MAYSLQTFTAERLDGEFCSMQCVSFRFLADIDLIADVLWELFRDTKVTEHYHAENTMIFPDVIFSEKSTK